MLLLLLLLPQLLFQPPKLLPVFMLGNYLFATSVTSIITDPAVTCNATTVAKRGHTTRFCKAQVQPTNQAPGAGVSQAFYGSGETEHFKRNCPKATTAGNTGRVLAMGQEETVVDPTVVTGMFLLDNSYACILFDSGAERSFCWISCLSL